MVYKPISIVQQLTAQFEKVFKLQLQNTGTSIDSAVWKGEIVLRNGDTYG